MELIEDLATQGFIKNNIYRTLSGMEKKGLIANESGILSAIDDFSEI